MRLLGTISALCLVLAFATHATAICRTCERPEDSDPPPAPECSNGTTRSCSTSNGCPGLQTCVNGNWSSCADAGQCPIRFGCPLSRQTINVSIAPDGWACTSRFLAQPGERIHTRFAVHPLNGSMRLYLYRQVGTSETLAATQDGLANFTVPYHGNYRVCAYNADWFFTHWIRITMDVAGHASPGLMCDQRPDQCFGARGPGCGLCLHTLGSNNLVMCPIQVGSQKHDTCCAHHPGGAVCGNVGYAGEAVNDQFCEEPNCSPPGDYDSPYLWCTAELVKGAQDFLAGNESIMLFDPTLLSYRPLVNHATQTADGHWLYGHPTATSLRLPDGQKVEYGDGEWCANGYHYQDGTGYEICGPEQ